MDDIPNTIMDFDGLDSGLEKLYGYGKNDGVRLVNPDDAIHAKTVKVDVNVKVKGIVKVQPAPTQAPPTRAQPAPTETEPLLKRQPCCIIC